MSFPFTPHSLLLTILFPFFLSCLCALVISRIGQKISLVDIPNARSSHSTPIPRSGGIGIWLSFILVPFFLLLLTPHPRAFLLGFVPQPNLPCSSLLTSFIVVAGFSGMLGLVEDRFNLPSKLRLAIQLFLSVIVVYLFSFPLTPHSSPLYSYLLTFFFWIVFITGTANCYNFMDGINGIAGLTGIVAFGLLAFFSYFVIHEVNVALMSIVLLSGCMGFLPCNFPKARVFMGDVGSIFLGFVFASFVMKLSITLHEFLCLIMFLCMFYADATVTIYYRWQRGESLMQSHRRHLYQYMCNELAIPHWKVSSLYAVVQLIFGVLSLLAYRKGLVLQFAVLGGFVVLFMGSYWGVKKTGPQITQIKCLRDKEFRS